MRMKKLKQLSFLVIKEVMESVEIYCDILMKDHKTSISANAFKSKLTSIEEQLREIDVHITAGMLPSDEMNLLMFTWFKEVIVVKYDKDEIQIYHKTK